MLLLAFDLEFLPDLDRVVHVDEPVGIGHHGLILGVEHVEVFLRLDGTVVIRFFGVRADRADKDVILFFDIGRLVPDVPDIDHVVRGNLALVERLHGLLERLVRARNRLGTVRLVLQQLALRAKVHLIVCRFCVVPDVLHPDGLFGLELAAIEQRENLMQRLKRVDVVALIGQVIRAEDHILRRNRDGLAVLRAQEVVGREHQHTRFCLGFCRQRHVNCHLVAVKVGVEGGAAKRMQLQRAAFDQHGLKGLDTEAVQRRRAVEHDGAVLDDVFERVPDLVLALVDHLLGRLDVVGQAVLDELFHHERAEQLDGHFLRHAALIELELRSDNDNRTAGIVNTFAEQVLTETALFALEHVGKGLERAVVCARDGSAAAAIVDQRIDRFLQHALFVADDDIRRRELNQAL